MIEIKNIKIHKKKWNKIKWLKRKFYTDNDIDIFINKDATLFSNFFNSLITIKERAYFFKIFNIILSRWFIYKYGYIIKR